MRKQDHLIKLIQTLTPAEKKSFRESAAKSNAPKSYMKLFEALQHVEHYNAEALCKKLGKTKANLAHEKEYLQEVLMKSLRDQHSDIFRLRINNTLNDIYVLWYRGLYQMAMDLTDKTIKEALDRGWFETLSRLYDARINIIMHMHPHSLEKFKLVDEVIGLYCDNLDKMKDHVLIQQKNLHLGALDTNRSNSGSLQEHSWLNNMLNESRLQKEYTDPVIEVSKYEVKAGINHVLKNWEEANNYREKILLLYELEPVKTQLHEQSYVVGYLSAINTAINAGRTLRAEELLNKLKNRHYRFLPLNMAYLDKMFDAYYYVHLIHLTLSTFHEGQKNIHQPGAALKLFEENFEQIKDNCYSLEVLQTCQRAGTLYFMMGDYDCAKKWLDYVVFGFDKDHAVDRRIASKLTIIIIHFQYGHYALLPSLSVSTTRYIKKWRNPTAIEKALLKFLASIPQKAEKNQLIKKLKTLKENLSRLTIESDADLYLAEVVEAWLKDA